MAAATISHLRRGHALLCLSRRHFSSAATASPLAITARRLVSTLVDHGTSSTGEAARPRPSAPTPPPSRYQHLAGRGGSSAVRRRQGRKNASTLVDHGKSLTGEATRPCPSTPTPPPSRHRRMSNGAKVVVVVVVARRVEMGSQAAGSLPCRAGSPPANRLWGATPQPEPVAIGLGGELPPDPVTASFGENRRRRRRCVAAENCSNAVVELPPLHGG